MSHTNKAVLITGSIFGLYEAAVWLFDPVGVHKALNNGIEMESSVALFNGFANSLPSLLGFLIYFNTFTWLQVILLPLLVVHCSMQTLFWWIPYLFNIGPIDVIVEHKSQLKAVESIFKPLPIINDHLEIDLEHIILFPITVIYLLFAVNALLSPIYPGWSRIQSIICIVLSSLPLVGFITQVEYNENTVSFLFVSVFVLLVSTSVAVAVKHRNKKIPKQKAK